MIHWSRRAVAGSLFASAAGVLVCSTGAQQADDEWPRYAHDAALTSRSPLAGRITQPRHAWSYSVAGREWLLQVTPAAGERRLVLDERRVPEGARPRQVAASGSPLLDLDDSGTLRPAAETSHERWAKILPNIRGWQRVAWSHTWTDQKVCRLQLFAYDQGFDKPRLVWQSDPPEDTIFQPLNLVYDLDQDGTSEICVAAHYRVMIFEGTTGRKETELRYHRSRPYGWFGLADVDGDGQMELITIGDFQSHIDVVNYDRQKPEPERLSVRWRRDIEQNIDERRKWPQVGPRPVVNVVGSPKPEIVLNLFNDTGDGQWHALVLNADTGQALRDLPRQFLQGTADVDGDGQEELFLAATDGVLVLTFGQIELVKLRGESAKTLWFQLNAAWAVADLPRLGPTWSTTASQGMRHVLVTLETGSNHPVFLTIERSTPAEPPFTNTLSARRIGNDNQPSMVWQITGLTGDVEMGALSAMGPGPNAGALLRLRAPANTVASLTSTNAEVCLVENRSLGVAVAPPIAARLRPGGPMTVMAEGAAQQIFAIQATPRTNSLHLAWRRPGRGMSDGSRPLGLLAADLEGDGGNEVIAADQDAAGRAQLVAYRHDGSKLWQHAFEQTPGGPPVWNVGALTYWWPGHFRDAGQTDLFVNTRRGLMHSDIGQLLDGRTGKVVWRQEKAIVPGQFNWGYAGIPPGIADVNGDRLDELISLYPVCFWIADGRTGRLLSGVDLAGRKKLPAWAAYGEPMLGEFSGRGQPQVLLDSPYILALLDLDGSPLWHGLGRADYPTQTNEGNVGQTTSVKHALIDFDGDGTFETASAGYGDGVRAIDPRDGKVLWSLAAPTPTCSRVVAANINGRKGEELLYVAAERLVAITGDRKAGRVLWEWRGPAQLSMPAIADVDGDGLAEVILVSADGAVHCLDSPP